MAHFAELNSDGIVVRVIAVHDSELMIDGAESEQRGIDFCRSVYGKDTVWVQTSYSGKIRKNYAGVGYKYDADRDAYIPPKMFESWGLNEATARWEAATPHPQDGKSYDWNEEKKAWIEMTQAAPVK